MIVQFCHSTVPPIRTYARGFTYLYVVRLHRSIRFWTSLRGPGFEFCRACELPNATEARFARQTKTAVPELSPRPFFKATEARFARQKNSPRPRLTRSPSSTQQALASLATLNHRSISSLSHLLFTLAHVYVIYSISTLALALDSYRDLSIISSTKII